MVVHGSIVVIVCKMLCHCGCSFFHMYMSVGFHMNFSQEMFLFGKRASHSQVRLIEICYICVL